MMWQAGMVSAVATDPMSPGLGILAVILGFGLAVVLHEVAHGYVAFLLGDPTAKYAGRLTLNPIPHIDLWGTILFPLFLWIISGGRSTFGWAKPVPVNYYNLAYGKYGPFIVALAGPGANLVLLIVFGLLARLSPAETALPELFVTIAHINATLMLFNILPVPPLDGSKILYILLEHRPDIIRMLETYGFYILLALLFLGGNLLFRVVFVPAIQLTRWISGIPF